MSAAPASIRRFRVAFSFAGERRGFVKEVAALLAAKFGEEAILYDKYHEAEFARSDLGIYLPNLYNERADLVVVVLCPSYNTKEWTGLEWQAIHDLLKQRRHEEVMLSRFDHARVDGLFSGAGFIELDARTAEQFTTLILERLALNERRTKDHYTRPPGMSAALPVVAHGSLKQAKPAESGHFVKPKSRYATLASLLKWAFTGVVCLYAFAFVNIVIEHFEKKKADDLAAHTEMSSVISLKGGEAHGLPIDMNGVMRALRGVRMKVSLEVRKGAPVDAYLLDAEVYEQFQSGFEGAGWELTLEGAALESAHQTTSTSFTHDFLGGGIVLLTERKYLYLRAHDPSEVTITIQTHPIR